MNLKRYQSFNANQVFYGASVTINRPLLLLLLQRDHKSSSKMHVGKSKHTGRLTVAPSDAVMNLSSIDSGSRSLALHSRSRQSTTSNNGVLFILLMSTHESKYLRAPRERDQSTRINTSCAIRTSPLIDTHSWYRRAMLRRSGEELQGTS